MAIIELNTIQKVAVVLAAASIGGILILHAPWEGYAYYHDIFDALSDKAVTYWFASILHMWVSITFVILIASLIVYLFRSPKRE